MISRNTQRHRQALLRLANAARRGRRQSKPSEEAREYDWEQPYVFTSEEQDRLNDFAKRGADRIGRGLTQLLRENVRLAADDPLLQFAPQAQAAPVEEDRFSIAVCDANGTRCGAVSLPAKTASKWVGRLLGSSQTDISGDNEPSPVETALLLDIVRASLQGLWAAAEQAEEGGLEPIEPFEKGILPLDKNYLGVYAQLGFRPAGDNEDPVLWVILATDVLEPVATGLGVAVVHRVTESDRTKGIRQLERTTVNAAACIGNVDLTIQQLMSLEPGDVVLTNRHVREPVDLRIGEATVLKGLPVRSGGSYALRITAS